VQGTLERADRCDDRRDAVGAGRRDHARGEGRRVHPVIADGDQIGVEAGGASARATPRLRGRLVRHRSHRRLGRPRHRAAHGGIPGAPTRALHGPVNPRDLRTTLRGKYRVDQVLGVGGMAVVYKVTHRNQAEFALKMLHPELSHREDVRTRSCERAMRPTRSSIPTSYSSSTTISPKTVRRFSSWSCSRGCPSRIFQRASNATSAVWVRDADANK
jgi:hypothetical protein